MNETFIGMDLHQRTSTLVVKTKDGELFDQRKIETTPEAVSEYVKQFADAMAGRELRTETDRDYRIVLALLKLRSG